MAKKRKGGREKTNSTSKDYDGQKDSSGWLKPETKQAIYAILALALSIFFTLAKFDYAGLAGAYSYSWLTYLFGAGYLLIPLVFFIFFASLLKSIRAHFLAHRLWGAGLLFLSLLGITSVMLGDNEGGVLGSLMAYPVLRLFDYYISLTFLTALSLVGLLIMFDTDLTFGIASYLANRKAAEEEEDDELDDDDVQALVINQPIDPTPAEVKRPLPPPGPQIKVVAEDEGLLGALNIFKNRGKVDYTPPPLSLLEKDSGKPGVGDIKANSNIIKRTLANFGINVEMDEISIGPSVTRYALKPAEGVKLSRIVGLQNDLSLALAAHPLRIEAPIPGKSLVGIEIPNTVKTTVGLGSLFAARDFGESPHPLLISLGRDISGLPFFGNLAKAPHILIAGTTGSGKSVTIHTLIVSLLYRNSPEQLRFIMIDPKRVELTLYNKIPHLLTPVITDPKKAIASLRWAAKEMDRRYNILESHAVRDIQSYHKTILEPALKAKAGQKTNEDEGDELEGMPYIVIVVDELADIMTSYPREMEAAIVRLAQMSRAVGIHLVLSTQRPSVEVITGLIKANIPSRVALQVSSQIDSRTIIDMPGAEKLLGAGDMLYMSGEMAKPVRLQSAFITENEVKKVSKYLAEEYINNAPAGIDLGGADSLSSGNGLFSTALDGDGGDDDELYEEAKRAVMEAGKASTSYIQRKLKVGYARAARLVDMLEERGVVGPGDGAKPREVYGSGGSGSGSGTVDQLLDSADDSTSLNNVNNVF